MLTPLSSRIEGRNVGLSEIENGPDVSTVILGELMNSAIQYINLLELATATMAAVGATDRMHRGARASEAYDDYFNSATNAQIMWPAIRAAQTQYELMLKIAAEDHNGR